MSQYYEFVTDLTDYSAEDDFDFITSYFEFSDDDSDYGSDDFDFVTMLFEFDAPVEPPPDIIYYLFEAVPGEELPPGEGFNPAEGIVLSFRDPKALNPFNAKKITGLDISKINPKYYRGSYGAKFYDLTLEQRKIVVTIGLNPDYASNESYSTLRDFVYKIISYSKTGEVKLYFKFNDTTVAVLTGIASKIDTNVFERTQEIELTIDCPDPLLKAPTVTNVDVDLFDNNIVVVDSESTAPHGFAFEMEIQADAPNLTISDGSTWFFTVAPRGGFLNNDILHFSSELNNRYLYIRRASTNRDLMNSIVLGSVWPVIFPGSNSFEFSLSAIQWRNLTYYKTYWGV